VPRVTNQHDDILQHSRSCAIAPFVPQIFIPQCYVVFRHTSIVRLQSNYFHMVSQQGLLIFFAIDFPLS